MPYKSEAQKRWFNENKEELAKKGVNVDKLNKESEGMKLPDKAGKLKKRR